MSLWSWVLGSLGVTGLLIAGNRVWWGWLINLVNEVLWVVYAVVTEQYGFILMAIAYGLVYARNARNTWRHHESR
jgi:hypothetical protein